MARRGPRVAQGTRRDLRRVRGLSASLRAARRNARLLGLMAGSLRALLVPTFAFLALSRWVDLLGLKFSIVAIIAMGPLARVSNGVRGAGRIPDRVS